MMLYYPNSIRKSLILDSIVVKTYLSYTHAVDSVMILFLILIFFLVVVGIYNYFFILPDLHKTVEVLDNSIYIRIQHQADKIPIDSITKLRLKNDFDLFRIYPWRIELEAYSNETWKTIVWYPIWGFIAFFKYPLNTTIIKEILRQNPKVELSDDVKIYLQTGRFHTTKLYGSWLTKYLNYRLISLVIAIIIWILLIIF